MDAVSVKNLTFKYDRYIFENNSFTVEKGSFTTIIGRGGSGKSTLFRILTGDEVFSGEVLILGKSINYSFEKGYIGVVSPLTTFNGTAIERLMEVVKGKTYDKIKVEIQRAIKKTGINEILDNNYNDLSIKEKVLVEFTVQILKKPKVLFVDNCFSYLDDEKKKIVREVLRLNKKCTVINITNNTDECIYGSDVIIIGDEFGKYKVSSMDEEDFISHGLDVPFMIALSSKLKFYDLISSNYLDMERLVNDLWE